MSNIVYPNRLKGSSIRLLELLPGDLDDELECRLVETPLHDITTFEALSYVWGDPAIREPIKCNGQAMTITTNLAQALRRLRLSRAAPSKGQLEQADLPQQEADEHDQSTGISRVLWADAICINQEDIIERGQQVQLMREIYTKATGVVVWLGADPQGHAKTAFAAIRTICSCLDAYEEVVKMSRDAGTTPSWMKGRAHFTFDLCAMALQAFGIGDPWEALRSLLNVPWWTRVWCVQEVYFAQQVLLIFGLDGIDGKQFTRFTIWYNREKQFAPYGLTGKERSLKLEETSFNDAFTNFNQQNLNSKDLCMICQSYRTRQATDARDKVYGLLGLWRPRSPEYVIEVDYNKSPAVVYTEVVLQAIKERKSLIVLRMVDHKSDYDYAEGDDFPSWVPRWDDSEAGGFVWLDKSPMRACEYPAEDPDPDLALAGVLRVKGHIFDKIVWTSNELAIGSVSMYMDEEFRQSVIQLYKEAIGGDKDPAYSHRVSVVELASGLTSGIIKRGSEALDNDAADPNAWLDITDIDTDVGRQYIKNFHTFMDTETNPGSIAPFQELLDLGGRRLFRTQRGYIGVGRRNTRIGDFVTVLHGGWVPYIVRLVSKDAGAYCTLVGDSFVHDIMRGQIYDMEEEGCMLKGFFEFH